MASLQTVALGLVIVFLDVPPDGFDWIADPLGWLLVLAGIHAARDRLPESAGLRYAGWACFGIAVLTWPAWSVAQLTDSIGWLFSLPTIAWSVLFCDAAMRVTQDGTRAVFTWLRPGFVLAGILPGLVFLAGWDGLALPATIVILVLDVALVLVTWSAAAGEDDEQDPRTPRERLAARRQERETRSGEAGRPTTPRRGGTSSGRSGAASAGSGRSSTDDAAEQVTTADGTTSATQVTGAEVVAKVRRRRRERERRAQAGD